MPGHTETVSYRTMLSGKIHRATVTQADLHYVGSLTVDEDLMDAAGLVEGEKVQVLDIDNGNRLETYLITGERGSGVIGVNGAAAHLVHPGDLTIIVAYRQVPEPAVPDHVARVVHVDAGNRIVALGADPAAPVPDAVAQTAGR